MEKKYDIINNHIMYTKVRETYRVIPNDNDTLHVIREKEVHFFYGDEKIKFIRYGLDDGKSDSLRWYWPDEFKQV